MTRYVKFRAEDWKHVYSKINWHASFLDADAIQILNNPIVEDDNETE